MNTTLEKPNVTTPRKEFDGRAFLKVKLKSLAAEAKIIRHEEKRNPRFRHDLRIHRIFPVRREARATLLAYGFIRGKSYRQIEPKSDCYREPDWKSVEAMVKKYGVLVADGKDYERRSKRESPEMTALRIERLKAWREEPSQA